MSSHVRCRLNYRLSIACHDTIMNKCADACTSTSIDQPCGGTVLRCLTEKLEDITDAECKKEVFYFIKMEVRKLLLIDCIPSQFRMSMERDRGSGSLCLQF